MDELRQYTIEECREMLLKKIWQYIRYWEKEERAPTVREKLEGLAFGILVILDGGTPDIPGFAIIPKPHEDDKEYLKDEGQNWWPPFEQENKNDIGGALHEDFKRYKPKEKS